MTHISASSASAFLSLMLIATALPAQSSDAASHAAGASKVRIVRLSEVKGTVRVDLNSGHGFEDAMPNLPIVEESRLQTGEGAAEVEFEDNSTLRLAPNSLVEFPRLELLPSGAKASTVHVLKGMVYVSLINTKGNEFTLLFGERRLQLPPSTHIRLRMGPAEAKLVVLEGVVQIEGASGTTEVQKKRTVTFPLADQSEPVVAKNTASEPFDSWDQQAADYHKRFASLSAINNNNSPYSYGVSDMMYYGSFTNSAGCGSMWHPYFASASWEPYSNGAWAWYAGAGYSWVSPYPWGWTPYHSGSWAFCPGAGWGWQPGGSWNGLSNMPAATLTTSVLPHPPVRPPFSGESSLVMVNLKPFTSSGRDSAESFVFRKDSAGMGVPRGTLGDLNYFSRRAIQHGTTTAVVYAAAPGSGISPERTTGADLAAPSMRQGLTTQSSPISRGSSLGTQTSTTSVSSSTASTASSAGHPH